MSQEHKDFKKLFNMNYVLNKLIAFGAYIILLGSILILVYMSFVETIEIKIDWKTIGIFSLSVVGLAWFSWNTFYHKQYEKVLSDDIQQQIDNKYSIHSRYYMAIKDWKDADLQIAIDKFNEEYTNKWLNWVERITGKSIETKIEKITDPETGESKIVKTKGIKDLPYRKFKHKILMWRIKNHKYPQSGYKTSMELQALFSFQEANMNKRDLKSDKKFYGKKASGKLLGLLFTIGIGASIVPTIIDGQISIILLKLILSIGALLSSVFTGAINGVRGARLKLSLVEDVCFDLERWANKKPIIAPYEEPIIIIPEPLTKPIKPDEPIEVTQDIFEQLKMTKE